ncbi:type VI secretion system baseplate subunit TssG [Azospirillum brasilense]|uniref:type VI secretion system baseplate subunit TssG n=1 Tax=Azospirillum brasilense TaxID=192 RepID=UPI000E0BCCB9|nr:type VI secretion system baseplate subunit TssG [Azospirillum brasilense]
MASPDRPPRAAVDMLEAIRAEPHAFGLYHALRLIECANPQAPRLGRQKSRVADEAVRLGQEPTMGFAPATLAAVAGGDDGRPHRLLTYGFGIFGPNGPMPLHITETVLERRLYHGDDTLARYADLFHHRLLSLFYRAWADAEPTVSHDRPDSDPFAIYLASLIGLGMPSLSGRDALPDGVRLHFAGRLVGQARNPEGLCAMITSFFGIPAAVQEFVRAWMDLPPECRWRLGGDRRSGTALPAPTLGEGLTLGARVVDAQHRFRIRLGPMGMDDYARMLPGGRSLDRLVALVRGHAGDEFAWDVQLVLRAPDVPPFRLDGSNRLGWTCWLGRRRADVQGAVDDADDLVLDPFAARPARAAPDRPQECDHGRD